MSSKIGSSPDIMLYDGESHQMRPSDDRFADYEARALSPSSPSWDQISGKVQHPGY